MAVKRGEIVAVRDITPASPEIRLRRYEARRAVSLEQARAVRDIAIALIQQPATGMLLGVVATEAAAKVNLINETERGLINAVLISSGLLNSFKPVVIGGTK